MEITLEKLYEIIQALAEEVKTVVQRVEKLENEVDDFESTDFASRDHYHDELASADHVERSEHSFNSQISNLRNSLDNLEYRINDVERKAENAQRSADAAQRSSGRGGWY